MQVRTNATIAAATQEGFRLSDGELVEGGVFVWAGGVKAPGLVADSGLATGHNGRVKVDQYLRVLDHPEIYVAGDLASVTDPRTAHVPLLITELVFVLVLRRVWIHQDVARAAWVSVSVVCVTLAVFLAVGEPTGGHPYPEAKQWLSAGLVFGGAIAVLTLAVLRGSPARRAAALAAATG